MAGKGPVSRTAKSNVNKADIRFILNEPDAPVPGAHLKGGLKTCFNGILAIVFEGLDEERRRTVRTCHCFSDGLRDPFISRSICS